LSRPPYRVMIVEDDDKLASILAAELERFGYDVVQAADFGKVREEFAAHRPDLVLLDINLPRYDGFYWCRQIRQMSRVPIIFISARDSAFDQVRALENGGDDFITKPFDLELCMAKIQSVIRRAYGEYALGLETDVIWAGGLWLRKSDNRASFQGKEVELSPKEARLLEHLMRRHGHVVSREELLEALWDDVDFVDDNTLNVNVARLRRRLGELGLEDAVETKRGQGYRLVVAD